MIENSVCLSITMIIMNVDTPLHLPTSQDKYFDVHLSPSKTHCRQSINERNTEKVMKRGLS